MPLLFGDELMALTIPCGESLPAGTVITLGRLEEGDWIWILNAAPPFKATEPEANELLKTDCALAIELIATVCEPAVAAVVVEIEKNPVPVLETVKLLKLLWSSNLVIAV